MIIDDDATEFTSNGMTFVRAFDGATSDVELDTIITEQVRIAMTDLAEQLADDPDFTDAERTSFLAKARPMAEQITRRNLYAMRAKLRH